MKCFYHNDMDGRCSAALVNKYVCDWQGDPDDFIECDYSGLDISDVNVGEDVYIVDYSFTEFTLDELQALLYRECNVVWIDHHDSSIDINTKYSMNSTVPGIRDKRASGAALCYMYFTGVSQLQECPIYIQLVSDYDTWKHEFKDQSDYFKLGIECHDYDALDDIWRQLDSNNDYYLDIIDEGELIYRYVTNDNHSYISSFGYPAIFEGLHVYCVNKKSNSWIFGDLIDKYDAVISYVFDGHKYIYSIFSNKDDVYCNKIAEKYHGGGHKGAAGFTSTRLIRNSIW